MSDIPKPPGGWLDQEHVKVVRAALLRQKNTHRRLRRNAEQHAAVLATDTNASAEYIASQRAVAVRYEAMMTADTEALEVFAGIEHGARVEALPSPEEEAAHEHARTSNEPCACGHGRRWHGDGMRGAGGGACHEGDCPCSEFVHA